MIRLRRLRSGVAGVVLILLLLLSISVVSSQGPDVPAQHQGLYNEIQARGPLPVFIGLHTPQSIGQAQATLIASLSGYNVSIHHVYRNIPFLGAIVDLDAFTFLANNTAVSSLTEVRWRQADLNVSVPLIGADVVHGWGYDGTGQVVAILDTGVDASHAYFGGRVVGALEGCYSTDGNVGGYTSHTICPNGLESQTGTGAAAPYASGVCQAGECDHGTHVAGIAAGNPGVASGADIMAVQVFSWIDGYGSGAWDWDIVAGMDWVVTNAPSYDIASVNLSLGGGSYSDPCPGEVTAFDTAAATLSGTYGTATVTSSGNAYSSTSLGWPACSPDAISVGATNDSDVVASFSNSAYYLDFLAPGVDILSSIPGGGTAEYDGTSMASPHVAGAFALMFDIDENASLSTVYDALYDNGVPITNSRNGLTFPRIQVDAAGATLLTTMGAGWYEEDHTGFQYNEYWAFKNKALASGGSAAKAKVGAVVSFTFDGDLLVIYRKLGPLEGDMEVCVDGDCELINNYFWLGEWTVPVSFGPFASGSGPHTVTISRPAGEARFWLDAVEIIDLPSEVSMLSNGAMYHEDASNFLYRGFYATKSKPLAIGGQVVKAKRSYAAVFFWVQADEFRYYSRYSPTEGAHTLVIDGVSYSVDLTNATKEWGYDAWVNVTLPYGTHYIGVWRQPGSKFFFDGVYAGGGAPTPPNSVGVEINAVTGEVTVIPPNVSVPHAAPSRSSND